VPIGQGVPRATGNGSVVIVEVPCETACARIRRLAECFDPMAGKQGRIIVDMSRVRSIDCSGLGAMLKLLHEVSAAQGSLKLCALSKPVRTVFELTRLHHVFDIYLSVDEALEAFQH